MTEPISYARPGTPSTLPIPIAETAAPAPRRRRRFSLTAPLVYLLLCTYLVIVVYPMFWLLYSSFKPDREIFLHPFQLPDFKHAGREAYNKAVEQKKIDPVETPYAEFAVKQAFVNFSTAWVGGNFQKYFFNSVLMTVSTVIVTTFLAAMTAYAVSRFTFPFSKPIFFYFLAGLMIPIQLAIVPLFFELKSFHMLDTRPGLFFVYLAFGFPFAVFVLTGFFKTLPASLHESAVLDGATEFQAFWHVMLPLARPGLITVAIFLFLGNWNEFFVAFMTISGRGSENIQTLPLGLARITIVSNYRSDWGMAFAGLVLMM
ncbi:MAG: N-acetylglucosamine transport system permease protein, partial [Humisphaera sp.]|nr:N-acetylglucosamine transport system permease protein [Humisphaera sp.]